MQAYQHSYNAYRCDFSLLIMQCARHAEETTTGCNTKIISETSVVDCKGDAATQTHFLEKSQLLFLDIFTS